jgi:hypothetical protein
VPRPLHGPVYVAAVVVLGTLAVLITLRRRHRGDAVPGWAIPVAVSATVLLAVLGFFRD